jgi:hypothetical protein
VPEVRLGSRHRDGVGPSLFALVERGVGRRPSLAAELEGEAVIRFEEPLAPVTVAFANGAITVADGDRDSPAVTISGRLPDIIRLATAPLLGGVPNPGTRGGIAALGLYATGRVRIEGDRRLARGLLQLLSL